MEAKTNISQPAEYLGYWEETYKNDLVNDVMPFWLKYGIDKENGGYFTCLNRDGSLMDSNKSVWFQGRFAFILAYAYNHIEKRQEWLQACKNGIDFIEKYCFDTDGRMFYEVTATGVPVRKRRYVFPKLLPLSPWRNIPSHRETKAMRRKQSTSSNKSFIIKIHRDCLNLNSAKASSPKGIPYA